MAGPTGAFVGDTLVELQAELVIAKNRVRYGDRIAMGGGQRTSQKSFSMSAKDHLREVRYALKLLAGTMVTSTHFDASGQFDGSNV